MKKRIVISLLLIMLLGLTACVVAYKQTTTKELKIELGPQQNDTI